MDTVDKRKRSQIMSLVGQKNTRPEMIVRRTLHALGFRYRLHVNSLPGSPDIVLPRFRKVIFVHGCYWHRHGCAKTTTPKSNSEFWKNKFDQNKRRDRKAMRDIRRLGWQSIVIWECQLNDIERLRLKLVRFLQSD
ncbi:very short patch repair endonuclease [Bremerella sp.]|uniref:very short patch repair endonuclease n=1 Tax=Bremerella sp. TaxID=2795602 RepID=UPI00391CB5CC